MKYKVTEYNSDFQEEQTGTCDLCYGTAWVENGSITVEDENGNEIEIELTTWDWGDYDTIYKAGADLMFDKETEERLEIYREKFMYRDEVELQVLEYLEMPIPDNWSSWSIQQQHQYTSKYFDNSSEFEAGTKKLEKVSTREMMYNLFMRNSNDKKLSTKINMIMDNNPGWEKGQFRIGGKNTKGFKRIKEK